MMDQFRFSEDTRPDEDTFQRLGYAMVPKQYIEAAGRPLKVEIMHVLVFICKKCIHNLAHKQPV
jgi:hypothetical protein